MLFLCPRHREQLVCRPRTELLDLWLRWMNEAALCSAMDEHARAVSYSGCGLDLMCSLAARQGFHARPVATKLCLSAIYAARLLTAMGESDKAATVLATAFRHLGLTLGDRRVAGWSRECMAVLLDDRRHDAFFGRYLNLPLVPATLPAPVAHQRRH